MRKLKLVMGGVWGLFAVATGLTFMMNHSLFMLVMAIGCGVLSGVCFAEYVLTRDSNNWM